MSVLRILLVDDERPARAKLRRLLADAPDLEIVGEADSGPAAVAAIHASTPDLVFLDIQMPGLDGFGVLDALEVEQMPQIVFVTAFDEHALRAFEVHALDYLLKPVDPARVEAVLERARRTRTQHSAADLALRMERLLAEVAPRPRYLRRVLVEDETRALLVPVERIDRFEAERNCVRLVTVGAMYRLRTPIGELAERLDPAKFLRINRSQIVRLDAVKELHPWSHGDYHVILHDGTTLTWSRRYRAESESDFGRGP